MSANGEVIPYMAPQNGAVSIREPLMPVMQMQQAVERYDTVLAFTRQIMKEGIDYGTIPGVDKPALKKPGAEKLCAFFGLTPRFVVVKEVEDWTGENHRGEPFFYYWYRCQLYRGEQLIAESDGSCNSRESKYRYRWITEEQLPANVRKETLVARGGRTSEFDFAIEKGDTAGRYGKPDAYWQQFRDAIASGAARKVQKKSRDGREFDAWEIDSTQYRVPNPDVADQVNPILKMAQKRALIAAVLIACNASEYYTQDLEDLGYIDAEYAPVLTHTAHPAAAGPSNESCVKREPKPAQSHGDTPASRPLDDRVLLAEIVDRDTAVAVFAELRVALQELLGEEGLAEYAAMLARFRGKDGPVTEPSQFPSRNAARACAAKLLQLIRRRSSSQEKAGRRS